MTFVLLPVSTSILLTTVPWTSITITKASQLGQVIIGKSYRLSTSFLLIGFLVGDCPHIQLSSPSLLGACRISPFRAAYNHIDNLFAFPVSVTFLLNYRLFTLVRRSIRRLECTIAMLWRAWTTPLIGWSATLNAFLKLSL